MSTIYHIRTKVSGWKDLWDNSKLSPICMAGSVDDVPPLNGRKECGVIYSCNVTIIINGKLLIMAVTPLDRGVPTCFTGVSGGGGGCQLLWS